MQLPRIPHSMPQAGTMNDILTRRVINFMSLSSYFMLGGAFSHLN